MLFGPVSSYSPRIYVSEPSRMTSTMTTATATEPPTLPGLLRLPLELRQQIYGHLLHLTVPSQGSHPLPGVGITSVSHAPPQLGYLLIHPTITAELLSHFYNLATWKIVFSHAFNFFRTDPELHALEGSNVVKRLKKVELVFFQDILLLREYPSFGLEAFCREIRRRADRACHVLLHHATELKTLTVSWIDTTTVGGWEQKADILEPLRQLKGKVEVRIGEVKINACDEEKQGSYETFVRAMREVLGEDVGEGKSVKWEHEREVKGEGTSELRMLAFDVRQQRCRLDDVMI